MNQRTAVVTGGNRGIGLEICRQLAQQGIKVVLTARNSEQGRAVADHLRHDGADVLFHPLDITDRQQIQALVEYIYANVGHLDILINNAGVYLDRQQPALTITPDLITQAIQTDVCGTFAMCQAVIPLMRIQHYGRIVNLSSRTSHMDQMNNLGLTYKISKAALNVLTVVLSKEMEGENILINAVNPGWIRTDMGGEQGTLSTTEGARGPVWLATLPDDGPTGCFFNGCVHLPW
jgi:NAD(P)-dependent dehydrogenase (short-subunit alcohol dehydrogenase family)